MFYSACGKRAVPLDYRKRYTSVTNCRYCEIDTNRYVVLRSNVRTLERVTIYCFSLKMQCLFIYTFSLFLIENIIVVIFSIDTSEG